MAVLAAQTRHGLRYGVPLFLISNGLTPNFDVMGGINLAHGSRFMVNA